VLALWPLYCTAQVVGGSYYGRGEVKTGLTYNTYLCELVIKKRGTQVWGELNYFFGQEQYSAKITGAYLPATKTIDIKPTRIITFFAKDSNAPDCLMEGSLTMYANGEDTVLYGQLNPMESHRYGCPVINMSFRKAGKATTDTLALEEPMQTAPPGADTLKPTKDTLIAEFENRAFAESPLIEVDTDTVLLHLYDNGRIDNDTVSVFFNRKPVLMKQRLSLKPVELKLGLSPGINEIAMFAENLGEIPPNTALCVVYAGGRRYDLNLSSTLSSNGTIRLQRVRKNQ
jgi:hypothetical protein